MKNSEYETGHIGSSNTFAFTKTHREKFIRDIWENANFKLDSKEKRRPLAAVYRQMSTYVLKNGIYTTLGKKTRRDLDRQKYAIIFIKIANLLDRETEALNFAFLVSTAMYMKKRLGYRQSPLFLSLKVCSYLERIANQERVCK